MKIQKRKGRPPKVKRKKIGMRKKKEMEASLKADIKEEEEEHRQEEEMKPEKEKDLEEEKEAADLLKEEVKSTKAGERKTYLTGDFSKFQEEALS